MITLAQAAQATGGSWLVNPLPPETPLHGGAFDTRDLGGAHLFFALAGEQGADGHDYLAALAGSSVRLAVVSRPVAISSHDGPGYDGAVLQVADTLAALGDLARFLVQLHRPRVVAVTGSYGKTTTKEEIAQVLDGAATPSTPHGLRVLKSPGSHNNEIGVPLTLLHLDGSQDVCVLEYSARKPGDIAYLSGIAPPHVAVLTAVGQAHIGVFGSREAIYATKGEIFGHLAGHESGSQGGLAVVGHADPRLRELARPHRTRSFGLSAGDFRAEQVTLDADGRQVFTGVCGETRLNLRASLPGPHGSEPVLAAWAVARELGVADATFAERAGQSPPQKGRLVPLRAPGGAALLDDSYNASPETVENLIVTLKDRPEAVKVLVLGPVAELEEGLAESARQIAAQLRHPLGQCLLYDPRSGALQGQLAAALEQALAAAGKASPERDSEGSGRTTLRRFERPAALAAALKALDAPGTVIGIKGARSAHMERFVQGLLGTDVTCERLPCALLRYCTDCERLSASPAAPPAALPAALPIGPHEGPGRP